LVGPTLFLAALNSFEGLRHGCRVDTERESRFWWHPN
jgi:hypothetical protein